MPANTVTEFRGRNRLGRSKRKPTRRANSPCRGKIGNTEKPNACTYCNPRLINSVWRHWEAYHECQRQWRDYQDEQQQGEEGEDKATQAARSA